MDNASNNDKMVDSLSRRTAQHFNKQNQGHCAAHILNLAAQDILSVYAKSQADFFDAEMDSDHADFDLPTDNDPQGDSDLDADDSGDDDEDAIPDLIADDDDDGDDYGNGPVMTGERSTCFLQKVQSLSNFDLYIN